MNRSTDSAILVALTSGLCKILHAWSPNSSLKGRRGCLVLSCEGSLCGSSSRHRAKYQSIVVYVDYSQGVSVSRATLCRTNYNPWARLLRPPITSHNSSTSSSAFASLFYLSQPWAALLAQSILLESVLASSKYHEVEENNHESLQLFEIDEATGARVEGNLSSRYLFNFQFLLLLFLFLHTPTQAERGLCGSQELRIEDTGEK